MLPVTLDVLYKSLDNIKRRLEEIPPIDYLEKIQDMWIRYRPRDVDVFNCIGAIDSGYNYYEIRGFFIYAVDAGYIDSCSREKETAVVGIEDLSTDPKDFLDLMSIKLETEILLSSLNENKDTLIIVDGSFVKKIFSTADYINMGVHKLTGVEILDLYKKIFSEKNKENIIFISKNSGAQDLLKELRSESLKIPDVYLLEEYTYEIGFSYPQKKILRILDTEYIVWISYIRIDVGGPVLRVEYFMEDENMSFIKRIIDAMNKISVKGFPAILSLVDERVRISSNDIEKIAKIIASEKRKR